MQYGEVSYVIVSSKKNGSAVVELKSVASAVSIQSVDINSFFQKCIIQTENYLIQCHIVIFTKITIIWWMTFESGVQYVRNIVSCLLLVLCNCCWIFVHLVFLLYGNSTFLRTEIWMLLCLIKDHHSPNSDWEWNLNPTFYCRNWLWKMSVVFLVTLWKYPGWKASHLQLMQTQKQF